MEDEQLPAGPDVWMPTLEQPDVETLTNAEAVSLQNVLVLTRDILTTMIQDVSDTNNIASVYGPFQVLVRQTLLAGRQFYADHGADYMVGIMNALLDSGKLDSPSVAHAPQAAEVAALVMELADWDREKFQEERKQVVRDVQAVIADAMDCVYKQAIGAPQTQGSMFARPEAS